MKEQKTVCAVSKCLLGEACRYDGSHRLHPNPPWAGMKVIGVCPELAAGLSVPRTPCEIIGGDGACVLDGKARVRDKNGNDKTRDYLRGAEVCAELCKESGVTLAYLKSKSPECGCGRIYDGSHSGKLIPGDGIFAALLKRMGVMVYETDAK